MALPIITPDDFKGWVKITANEFKASKLTEYITLFREQYLRMLVGDAAYADIEAQTRQKWTDLLNGVTYTDSEGKRKYHTGLFRSLTYFIYFEFTRDNFTNTQTGKVKGSSENSERVNASEVLNQARSRFNLGASLANNSTPGFLEANEKFEEVVTASVEGVANVYTLSIASTKYLEAEDFVTFDGFDFKVLTVAANTSIEIQASTTGLDFTGLTAVWEPFEEVEFCGIEPCGI